MKRKPLLVVAIALTVLLLTAALAKTGYADPPAAPPAQAAPLNTAVVDITINDAGGLSIGGFDITSMGTMPLDQQVVNLVKSLGNAHLVVEGQEVALDLQGTPVVRIEWSPESRQASANLATKYGVQLSPPMISRIEQWINNSNVDVTARYANESSKPAEISLSTPFLVDIADNGQLSVESIPLAAQLTTDAVNTLRLGGAQATACWNKGRLSASVDGAELPTIVLNPEGVQVLNQALGLQQALAVDVNALKTAILGAKFGVDLTLPGGTHSNATCPD